MQNKEIEKAIPWNPWHGCKKVSVGCKNCFVYKMDQRYGKDASIITKGKTTYELMLMYGKEASNRKQEIDRQHYTIPNQRPKDKHCGKI